MSSRGARRSRRSDRPRSGRSVAVAALLVIAAVAVFAARSGALRGIARPAGPQPGAATTSPAAASARPLAEVQCSSANRPPPGPGATVFGHRVVAEYPHDRTAFTQGLVYHAGALLEGTGLYGESSLREVELATGRVIRSVDLAPEYFGEGIALWEDKVLQLTWKEQTGFVYDLATFERLDEWSYRTEGWGLTHDGTHLLMSDGTDVISRLDPDTRQVVERMAVRDGDTPIACLNELEYIDGELWANVWLTDWIVIIDPASGAILAWVDFAGLLPSAERAPDTDVLNGIAYDASGDRLFVTGKRWPKLYEVRLEPERTAWGRSLIPFALTVMQ